MRRYVAALLLLGCSTVVSLQSAAQCTLNGKITLKAIAEVETRVARGDGRSMTKLLPADRVVPGDEVIYTVEIRNTAATALPGPCVDYPVPEHMRYLDDSAVGPGAEVSYSVDGGRSFDRAENLRVPGPGGALRAATGADYTHIRWQLKNMLKGNSVAFARFRAIVK